ncbi:FGGY family of carbohydrate kinase [Striga hermonthica]|uniref:FGGY carbohydrate kinase domain-containing protein n=1 Tax=Striga hermonthica TaxID=68872 RepID=A0A9N7NT43_STRHE|nr:FGGY family of carbohydrate kinase [Striga hermonthica]
MSGAHQRIYKPAFHDHHTQRHRSTAVEMTSAAPPPPSGRSVFLGVDVGTGSARAGLFDNNGRLLGCSSSPIQIWKEGDCVEQSSTDIWLAICTAVKAACALANVSGSEVTSLGFAATCSLVAVDYDGEPVTVSWSGDTRRNIIVWMDHRAVEQAERINSSKSPVLEYCGGAVSPEMEPPKLLWVKENLQESWSMAFRWMDLSDWLSYRATGDDTRSLCTTVCKWTYLGHAHMHQVNETGSRDMEALGWDDQFWEEIGLGDLVDSHHSKIGRSVAFPGYALGSGLTPDAAKARIELGLVAGTPVGTSLIDAHAGGIGVMESVPVTDREIKENDGEEICHRMVLVCGTSTCHMAISKTKLFIPGVWGPFWSAMVPQYWLTEGGQSATGALLDYIIDNHIASPHLANKAASRCVSIFELLNEILESMKKESESPFVASLTADIHINTLLACGGLTKNSLFIQEHADITGYPIVLPRENESVLLGAAIIGSVASKKYPTVREAMKALNASGQVVYPSKDPKVRKYHDAKYQIFRDLYKQQLSHRSMMKAALS